MWHIQERRRSLSLVVSMRLAATAFLHPRANIKIAILNTFIHGFNAHIIEHTNNRKTNRSTLWIHSYTQSMTCKGTHTHFHWVEKNEVGQVELAITWLDAFRSSVCMCLHAHFESVHTQVLACVSECDTAGIDSNVETTQVCSQG